MQEEEKAQAQCSCCGLCCQKGGATLQKEDMPLVAAGFLPPRVLVTVRAGELAYDEAQHSLSPRKAEMVKLAGTGEAAHPWHCVLHRADKLCGIHEHRPAQCRALFCRDTAALEALYAQGQATRHEVLLALPAAQVQGWAAVWAAYEERCALELVLPCLLLARQALEEEAASKASSTQAVQPCPTQAHAVQQLLDLVRYDYSFRAACSSKGGIAAENLPFLLGRALPSLLDGAGIKLCLLPEGRLGLGIIGRNYYAPQA